MNQRIKSTIAVAATVISLATTPVLALEGMPQDPNADVQITGATTQGEKLTLSGIVEYQDLEGGFYAVDGYALVGDPKLIASLAGQQVVVHGQRDESPSILMVTRIAVESILTEIKATRPLPGKVAVAGKAVAFDQPPVISDGTLMVPLRAVVEAAGGWVEWNAKDRSIHVEMPDRQAWFWVGESKAEMNLNNARYFARNLLPMAKSPVIQNGRTLISAESLTQILGLYEVAGAEGGLTLSPLPQ